MTAIPSAAPRRTRGKLTRTLLATTTLVTGLLGANAALAYNVNVADLREHSFTIQQVYNQQINVVSSSGAGWDKIEPGSYSFGAHVNINTKHYIFYHGVVIDVGLVLGACGDTACTGKPLLWADHPETNDYENQMEVTFSTSKIPVSSGGGIATVPFGDEIIARCNEGTPGQAREFTHLMPVTFVADTIQQGASRNNTSGGGGPGPLSPTWQNSADHTLTRNVSVSVRCKPYEPATSRHTDPPPPNPHRTVVNVQDIDLFLSTYQVPQSGPNGTTCKPLKVTTRIQTDKAGPVNVKLWRQVNGGPITAQEKRMEAQALGTNKFGDDWNKFEHFTQTTTVQYKAEIMGGTFAPSTEWKSITIHCNGDFAAPQSNANPDNGVPPRGKPQAELPPTIVTPPPTCGTKAAKVRGSAPCVKTAPLPDKRKEWAEQKRKQAEEKRRLAKESELRRREADLKTAEMQQRQTMVSRPFGAGRFGPPAGARMGVFRPGMMFSVR